jgi:hypothetical protein
MKMPKSNTSMKAARASGVEKPVGRLQVLLLALQAVRRLGKEQPAPQWQLVQ